MILTYIYKYIERLSINAKMLRRNRGSVMEFHFWSTYNMNDTNIKCRQFHHTFVWPRIRAGICKDVTFCLLLPVSFSWVYIQCCMFCMENPMLRSCSSRSTRCVSSAYFSWFYSIRIIMNLRHWFLGKNNLDFKPLHVYDSKFQFCYEILEFGRINCNCYVLNGNECLSGKSWVVPSIELIWLQSVRKEAFFVLIQELPTIFSCCCVNNLQHKIHSIRALLQTNTVTRHRFSNILALVYCYLVCIHLVK